MQMGEWLAKYWLEVAFGLIVTGFGIVLKKFGTKLKEEKARSQAIESGVRDMLRLTILDNYERCKQAGVISVSRKDAIDSAYNSYHALGGNGTITQVHTEIMAMPIVK